VHPPCSCSVKEAADHFNGRVVVVVVANAVNGRWFFFRSPFEQPHDLCPRQRIEMQIEADDRSRCVGLQVNFVGLHGEHSGFRLGKMLPSCAARDRRNNSRSEPMFAKKLYGRRLRTLIARLLGKGHARAHS
jgi:hypothetical protein